MAYDVYASAITAGNHHANLPCHAAHPTRDHRLCFRSLHRSHVYDCGKSNTLDRWAARIALLSWKHNRPIAED